MSKQNRARNFHRAGAVVWTLLLIPAYFWWSESVLFVIFASVYANVKSDWGAAEAADDTQVLKALSEIKELLVEIKEQLEKKESRNE